MPSNAFILFKRRRRREVLEIADIFDQVNNRPGPNRHYGLLNGALVLLVSSWEIYCEEVCEVAVQMISGRATLTFNQLPERMKRDIIICAGESYNGRRDPLTEKIAMLPDGGWKTLLKAQLDEYISGFNTPKFSRQGKNLNELFRHILGIRMSMAIDEFLEEEGFCQRVDGVVTLRGEIAHAGEAAPENRLSSALLRQYAELIVEATAAVEAILHREFREQLGFAPWQITQPVRESLRAAARARL